MKWKAKSKAIKSRYYVIKSDPQVGYYFYVFENGKCIKDYLQDTLELTMEFALEDFGVPIDAWERIEN